jgi:hypothetical protein
MLPRFLAPSHCDEEEEVHAYTGALLPQVDITHHHHLSHPVGIDGDKHN